MQSNGSPRICWSHYISRGLTSDQKRSPFWDWDINFKFLNFHSYLYYQYEMMPCCGTMRKNVRSFEFQNPWRNSIFSDWLDLNFNLAYELPQTLPCCWFPLVLMSDWNHIGYSLMHHHQFPRLHHDGILHVALIPYPTGSLVHNLGLAQVCRTNPWNSNWDVWSYPCCFLFQTWACIFLC